MNSDGKCCLIYGKLFATSTEKVVFIKKISQISADNLDIMEAIIELERNQKILFEIVSTLNQSLNGEQTLKNNLTATAGFIKLGTVKA